MAAVATLRSSRQPMPGEMIDLGSTYRSCTVAARLLNEDLRRGAKITHLADKLGKSHQTISKIISRETKEPRWSTLFDIFKYYKIGIYGIREG